MDKPSWERKKPSAEQLVDEKVRAIMYKRKVTYQEALSLVKNGQKAIFEF